MDPTTHNACQFSFKLLIPLLRMHALSEAIFLPVGVVVGLSPFNLPSDVALESIYYNKCCPEIDCVSGIET